MYVSVQDSHSKENSILFQNNVLILIGALILGSSIQVGRISTLLISKCAMAVYDKYTDWKTWHTWCKIQLWIGSEGNKNIHLFSKWYLGPQISFNQLSQRPLGYFRQHKALGVGHSILYYWLQIDKFIGLLIIHYWSYTSGESSNQVCVSVCLSSCPSRPISQ